MPQVKNKNIWDILRKKYPTNEYALMQEVSDAAGFNRSNSADYIAVNMWPSRGLAINGIELKSSRSDWLSELKNPKKAENIFKYCDYFWLLTTDETIAKIDEIPETWGWKYIKGDRIKVIKNAPKLTPIPVDRNILIGMLKRAEDRTGFVPIDSIQDRIDESVERAISHKERENTSTLRRASELISIVSEFEKSSGIRFGNWNGFSPEKVGEAVRFISSGGAEKIKKDLLNLKVTADKISEKINSTLDVFEDLLIKKDY